jgi:hypothetical protein
MDKNGSRNGNRTRKDLDLRIGTWNIRTLFKLDALKCMMDEIIRYKIPIVAIQEVRWLNSGSIQSGKSIIFYSGLQTGRYKKGVMCWLYD